MPRKKYNFLELKRKLDNPPDNRGVVLVDCRRYLIDKDKKIWFELFQYTEFEFAAFSIVDDDDDDDDKNDDGKNNNASHNHGDNDEQQFLFAKIIAQSPSPVFFFRDFVIVHDLTHPITGRYMQGGILRLPRNGFTVLKAQELKDHFPVRMHCLRTTDENGRQELLNQRVMRQHEISDFVTSGPRSFIARKKKMASSLSSPSSSASAAAGGEMLFMDLTEYNEKSLTLIGPGVNLFRPILLQIGFDAADCRLKHPDTGELLDAFVISPFYVGTAIVRFFSALLLNSNNKNIIISSNSNSISNNTSSSMCDSNDAVENCYDWFEEDYDEQIAARNDIIRQRQLAMRPQKDLFWEMLRVAPAATFSTANDFIEQLPIVFANGDVELELHHSSNGQQQQQQQQKLLIKNTIVNPEGTRMHKDFLKMQMRGYWDKSLNCWVLFGNRINDVLLNWVRENEPRRKITMTMSTASSNVEPLTHSLNVGGRIRQRNEDEEEEEDEL